MRSRFHLIILISVLSLLPSSLNAQGIRETLYLNSEEKETTKELAKRYVIVNYDDSTKTRATASTYTLENVLISAVSYKHYSKSIKDGPFLWYYNDGSLQYEEHFDNDTLHGVFRTYYRNGKLRRDERYDHGKLLEGKCFTAEGKDTIYFEFRILPQYEGGETAMAGFIMDKVKYPSYAIRNNIQGMVYVSFVVDKQGKVKDVTVKKGVHPLLDEEAVRVIKKMKKWSPGKMDGYPVSMRMVVPVNYKIKE